MNITEEQNKLLKEILKWIKISSFQNVQKFLLSVLDTDTKKLVYQLSDGNHSRNDIIKKAKASPNSISKYWQEWDLLGIGETKPERSGTSFIRSFDLTTLGIEVPSVKGKMI